MAAMGFRFRRSVKVAPGIRLNFSSSGVSTSIGPRGAKVTVGHGRVRQTVGIPGTGISYTESHRLHDTGGTPKPGGSGGLGALLIVGLILFAMAGVASGSDEGLVAVLVLLILLPFWIGYRSRRQAGDSLEARALAAMHAAKATLDRNQPWLHERWVRADAAQASGDHSEFPPWYFDAVTQPQLERVQDLHLQVHGGDLTKGAASDLIGLFAPVEEKDAEVCRFFHLEIPPEFSNETRGRMEAARLLADPAKAAAWQARGTTNAS
jgi:hypothetical protein